MAETELAAPATDLPEYAGYAREGESRAVRARRRLADLWGSKKGSAGATIVLLLLLTAALAPILAPYDPAKQSPKEKWVAPTLVATRVGPAHPFGTDYLGRDVLSRVIYGAQVSVSAGFLVIVVAATFGSVLGALAGYFGGVLDVLIMRLVDFQLSFPFVLLAIIFMAIFGPGFWNIVIALAIALWVNYARLVRGETLKLRELEFVQAARAIGVPRLTIVRRHILPNVLPGILVLATLDVAFVIIYEASLSFLGLGIQPPTPSWGILLNEGYRYLAEAWWMTVAPAVAIILTSLGINLLGDWLRDTIDPTLIQST
jgi:ABC-type dipeptide/oligopeptide/nickel transport system permease subunit